jgi:hypothetical protein
MGKGARAIVIVLIANLGAAVAPAIAVWQEPGEPMPASIVVPMALGVVFTVVVGGG